jgi:hypothetical protein
MRNAVARFGPETKMIAHQKNEVIAEERLLADFGGPNSPESGEIVGN